jgi:hypothetical protein
MVSDVQLVGLFLAAFGLPGALWPYRVARFQERVQGIGSSRSWDEIEPADWNVSLTRAAGILFTVVGLLWFVGA